MRAHTNDQPPSNTPTIEVMDNRIYFYGDVETESMLILIRRLREVDDRLQAERISRRVPVDHPYIPIWLHIHTPGGAMTAAFSVADEIERLCSPVWGQGQGMVASAGTLILMACHRRFATPNTTFLFHQLSSLHWGTHESFKDEVKWHEMLMEQAIALYVRRSKVTRATYNKWLKRDTWLTAGEALQHGIIDDLV